MACVSTRHQYAVLINIQVATEVFQEKILLQGAVCGMFLSSSLKAQEEHYKLHTAIASMKAGRNCEIGDSEGAHTVKTSEEHLTLSQAVGSTALNSEAVRVDTIYVSSKHARFLSV